MTQETESTETAPAQAPDQPAPDGAAQEIAQQPVEISCTRGLADWLVQHQVSLGFSSYQIRAALSGWRGW